MPEKTRLILCAVICIALLFSFAFGFFAGESHQVPIDVRCYDTDGHIVKETFPVLSKEELNVGVYILPSEMQDYNATACWVGLK